MDTLISPSPLAWKSNWLETRQRFVTWWQRRGCVVGGWCVNPPNAACHDASVLPVACPDKAARITDPDLRARLNHGTLNRRSYWGDSTPMTDTNIGPGSLALLAGAEPGFAETTVYHLDGTQAIHHLDALLEIESLDAIEWTPQAGIEEGGHPRWYSLYQRILAAGKSVQAVCVKDQEVDRRFRT